MEAIMAKIAGSDFEKVQGLKLVPIVCTQCGSGDVKLKNNEHLQISQDGRSVSVINVGTGLTTGKCSNCGTQCVLSEGSKHKVSESVFQVKVKQGKNSTANIIQVNGNVTASNFVQGNNNKVKGGNNCPRCQNPYAVGAKFCSHCGKDLT
jgi:hypothetical protein